MTALSDSHEVDGVEGKGKDNDRDNNDKLKTWTVLSLFCLQEGVDAVKIVGSPHLLHSFFDLVLLLDGLIGRRNALKQAQEGPNSPQ